jgi:hypothetical protein
MESYNTTQEEDSEDSIEVPIQEEFQDKDSENFDLVKHNNKLDHIPISIVKFVKGLSRNPTFTKIW